MPITFNSEGGFLNGTISSSGNNLFIQTSGSVGVVHLDGSEVLVQSKSAGNAISASIKIEDDNLVINDNLRVKRNEFRFKSADRTKEVKIDVSDNGNIRFKDNDDKEIVKFREGGRIDLGQNDTANSQSLTNWNGSISASGFVKCKNTFLGHNYGFPDNFILAHSDRVQNEDSSLEAGRGFAFGQNPSGHTFINAGDGTNAGYESINFYQAGLPSSILGKNRNWQFGLPIVSSVQFEPPEKLTVEGNISASGTIFANRLEVTQITSSIVTSSILQTEGSNIFGDAITDTQTFNGHITASGNISASGAEHIFGGLVKIIAPSDNTSLLRIQDVDNDNNFVFSIDSNQHSDFHIERNSTDKIRFNSYHPAQIDNDAYETFGGLILGSDVDRTDKSGFGLYVSAGPDSGSIYTKERVFIGVGGATGSNDMLSVGGNITTTSHITASGDISASGTITTNNITIHGTQFTNRIDRVDNAKTGVVFGDGIRVSGGHITASGNISSSGTITGNEFIGGTTQNTGSYDFPGAIVGYNVQGLNVGHASYDLTTTFAVPDAGMNVCFVAPKSGIVEIEVQTQLDMGSSTGTFFYLALSDSATYNSVASYYEQFVCDPDENDDVAITHKWVVPSLTPGTTYKYWMGAKVLSTTGTPKILWGGNGSQRFRDFIMKATALPSNTEIET